MLNTHHSKTLALLSGLALSTGLAAPAHATIMELTMTTPIAGLTGSFFGDQTAYVAPGDIATLTIRYDTSITTSVPFGGASTYKNAVTYFGFSLERGGVETYSGSVSGNFGQIDVADNTTSGGHDRITFRLFDDFLDYPGAVRAGTTPLDPLSPLLLTGDATRGDIIFRDFRVHFTTTDETVLTSQDLPELAVFTGWSGSGSPFSPAVGTTPWAAGWVFENDPYILAGRGWSMGSGSPDAGEPYDLTVGFNEYTPGGPTGGGDPNGGNPDGGATSIPEPAGLGLLGLGFVGLARMRRRKGA